MILMSLEEAVAETKNFIKAEAKLAGVEPKEIMERIKGEVETAEFVRSVKGG